MKRKLCSVLVTAALLLSATVPAFADNADGIEGDPSNETSACTEAVFDSDSVSASEEGTVEDNNSNDMSDAPLAVEGFTADDSAETSNDASNVSESAPEPAFDDDNIIVTLDGVLEPDDEPATESVSEPVEELATESVSELDGESKTESVSAPVEEPETESVSEANDEPATENVSEANDEPATENVSEANDEPATENVSAPVEELTTESVSESDEEPATESVSEPVEEPASGTEGEPVTESASEELLQKNIELSPGGLMAVKGTPLTPDEEEEDFATLLGIIPTISVTVPSSANIIINPYRMSVQQGSDTCHDEIISDTSVIVSHSDVALNIEATAIGWADNPSSEVRFVGDASDMQNKDLFVYYEFLNVSDASGDAVWSGDYSAASNQLIVQNRTDTLPTPTEVLTIPAAADSTSPSYAALRAFGSASVPDTGVWKATDTVNIRLAFTFEPV